LKNAISKGIRSKQSVKHFEKKLKKTQRELNKEEIKLEQLTSKRNSSLPEKEREDLEDQRIKIKDKIRKSSNRKYVVEQSIKTQKDHRFTRHSANHMHVRTSSHMFIQPKDLFAQNKKINQVFKSAQSLTTFHDN
jgi:hypothetical protein